jgi:sarcosine oxidase subunit beta
VRALTEPPRTAELVVVGGGIVGAATAFFAARRGISTVLLEARPAVCTLTSAFAAGGYRLQLEHSEELPLVRRTAELVERFADETGHTAYDPALRRQGYLWVTRDPGRVDAQRRLVERQRAFGVDGVEHLTGDAARERFPWLAPDVAGARFRAGDGFIDPRAIVMGLVLGGGFGVAVETPVTGIDVAGGRVIGVRTPRGDVSARAVVIACGPFSALVAALAGVALPLVAVRRHRLVVWNEPSIPADAPMTIDEDTTAHWRPAPCGAYGAFPDPAEAPAEPAWAVPADPGFALRLLDPASDVALAHAAPFWADVWRRNTVAWSVGAGQYEMTPDHRPLIGETEIAGLYTNTGYSGHGVMAGPGGSELLAGLLAGDGGDALDPFRLDREFEAPTQAF